MPFNLAAYLNSQPASGQLLPTGGINRAVGIPPMLRTPPAMLQHPLDLKAFLPFHIETPHTMGLLPNFGTMDPVQKAVINHTFGVPLVKTKRPIISCNVCQIRFNSESQAEAHYKGNRHARRVKGIETAKTRQRDSGTRENEKPTSSATSPTSSISEIDSDRPAVESQQIQNGTSPVPPVQALTLLPRSPVTQTCTVASPPVVVVVSPPPLCERTQSAKLAQSKAPKRNTGTPPAASASNGSAAAAASSESEEDKAKKLLYCSLCKVAVNSLSQLEAHNKGTKHKTILEARSGLGPIKAYPRLGPKLNGEQGNQDPNSQERTFHCEICNVKVNSEVQLKQHISSRRHRDGVAGKPNPLLNRHKKHRTIAELATSLAFHKDHPKALGAGLFPNPLAVAAAMAAAASSPLTLRPAPTASLLQTHHLLRPAPGPIRTSHGPILFSPY
ncbi:zinc finger protein 385A isoform X3 [Latimeria chalumnae]